MWAEKERGGEKGRENHSSEEFTANPRRNPVIEGSSWAPEVPGVSQRHSASTYPPGPRIYAHAAMHVRIHIPETVIPLHLLATQKPPSPHCVQPSPIIPFGTGCTATKAEKLGSCVDDRATNLFGGTHYMSSLYSSAAERGELNMDMQRWVSL